MRFFRTLAIGASLILPGAAQAQSYGFATYSARINYVGLVVFSNGVKSVNHTGSGMFDVVFARDVSMCVPVASIYNVTPGYLDIALKSGTTDTLTVGTYATSGVPTDRAFTIIVTCGP